MRILTIRESSWLNASPGPVWARLLQLEEWPEWNDGIAEARWLGQGWMCHGIGRRGWKPGNRFRLVPAGPRRAFLGGGVVTAVDTEREVRWLGRFLTLRVEFALAVSAEGPGTRVELRSTFRGFSVRFIGQDSIVGSPIVQSLGEFQRQFLTALRESGERVGAR